MPHDAFSVGLCRRAFRAVDADRPLGRRSHLDDHHRVGGTSRARLRARRHSQPAAGCVVHRSGNIRSRTRRADSRRGHGQPSRDVLGIDFREYDVADDSRDRLGRDAWPLCPRARNGRPRREVPVTPRDGSHRPSAHLVVVPALVVLFHVLFLRGYGWFRDEFYYYACARHLAFGYVDHPALSIVPLWIVRALVGDSLFAARLLAALASGAVVAVVGLTARDMGGGRFAQTLAMVCAAEAPVYLAIGSFYSMNVFDVLVWAIAAWFVVRLVNAPTLSRWIALGIALGLGVENKISVLWLIGGLSI